VTSAQADTDTHLLQSRASADVGPWQREGGGRGGAGGGGKRGREGGSGREGGREREKEAGVGFGGGGREILQSQCFANDFEHLSLIAREPTDF
jgi:hypothetical protein